MSAFIASPEQALPKSERKHKKEKKDKSSKSEKKRDRDEDAIADSSRRHKKSKSESVDDNREEQAEASQPQASNDNDESEVAHKKGKKEHKKKHKEEGRDAEDAGPEKKKTKKKSKKHADEDAENDEDPAAPDADADAVDVEQPAQKSAPQTASEVYQPSDIPARPQYPFYSQTVSLYEPIYPIGWAQPVTNSEYQHLQHLKNKYVPSLRGVLMNYKNVALGENPGRKGAATSDDDPTVLKSINEYAVGFGWITAEVELFVPSRGAWMEGSINLQTEGHIGVVCFGQFNASIEARRLPSSWKWVSNEDPEAHGMEETASVITADDHGVVRQIHSTGFWVDADGNKVKGKIRFRIRNFDVGVSGETSYLSLEGTMLEKEAEKALVREEAATAALRKGSKGGRNAHRRRAPEFAMTRFMDEEEQQPAETPAAEV